MSLIQNTKDQFEESFETEEICPIECIIKIKWTDLETEEYDGSTQYFSCNLSFEDYMYSDPDVIIYNSQDEFTEPSGEYCVKVNDDHYEYVRREVVKEVDPGWIYNGTKEITVNKTLISYKRIDFETIWF
jgi:hypothetical protein